MNERWQIVSFAKICWVREEGVWTQSEPGNPLCLRPCLGDLQLSFVCCSLPLPPPCPAHSNPITWFDLNYSLEESQEGTGFYHFPITFPHHSWSCCPFQHLSIAIRAVGEDFGELRKVCLWVGAGGKEYRQDSSPRWNLETYDASLVSSWGVNQGFLVFLSPRTLSAGLSNLKQSPWLNTTGTEEGRRHRRHYGFPRNNLIGWL